MKRTKNRYFDGSDMDCSYVVVFKGDSSAGTAHLIICGHYSVGELKHPLNSMKKRPKWPEITRSQALKLIPALKDL